MASAAQIDLQPQVLPESAQAARMCELLALATTIWGNEQDALRWLTSPHPLIHGATPASLLDTQAGGEKVKDLLSALDNGFPV